MNNDEEQAIIREIEAFSEAWQKGDSKTAASFYTGDATRVGAYGDIQHGVAEIEKAYDRLLHATMPGAQMKQERGSVRFLSTELAVWQGGDGDYPAQRTTAQRICCPGNEKDRRTLAYTRGSSEIFPAQDFFINRRRRDGSSKENKTSFARRLSRSYE